MDFENMNIWCWLIPALVGIIRKALSSAQPSFLANAI